MYVILLKYLKPTEEVDRVVAAHRSYLDTLYAEGVLLASGPQVPRTGGVLLAKGIDKQELQAHLAKDPFALEGIADYTVIEFDPVKYQPSIKDLL